MTIKYLEDVLSKIPFRWDLEELRLWEVEASMVYVVGDGEVATKTAREKKFNRQSRSSYGSPLTPLTVRVARHCVRSIKAMSR